jgi:hypothetical protein
VLEGLPQQPEVGSGVELELLGEAAVDAHTDVIGKLRDRGLADQVVR